MLIISSYGKNVIVGNKKVGYITRNAIIVSNQKFADITDEGVISIQGQKIGYVEDNGDIIIRGKCAGYIDSDNNFVFHTI